MHPPGSHPTEPGDEKPTDEVTLESHFLAKGLKNTSHFAHGALQDTLGLGRHLLTLLGKALQFTTGLPTWASLSPPG